MEEKRLSEEIIAEVEGAGLILNLKGKKENRFPSVLKLELRDSAT